MEIAIDWDDTITADKDGWQQVINLMQQRGHEIVIVTARYQKNTREVQAWADKVGVELIATDQNPKIDYISPDVWIDDKPRCIYEGFKKWGNKPKNMHKKPRKWGIQSKLLQS